MLVPTVLDQIKNRQKKNQKLIKFLIEYLSYNDFSLEMKNKIYDYVLDEGFLEIDDVINPDEENKANITDNEIVLTVIKEILHIYPVLSYNYVPYGGIFLDPYEGDYPSLATSMEAIVEYFGDHDIDDETAFYGDYHIKDLIDDVLNVYNSIYGHNITIEKDEDGNLMFNRNKE